MFAEMYPKVFILIFIRVSIERYLKSASKKNYENNAELALALRMIPSELCSGIYGFGLVRLGD